MMERARRRLHESDPMTEALIRSAIRFAVVGVFVIVLAAWIDETLWKTGMVMLVVLVWNLIDDAIRDA